jgi:hypothetical protein
VSKFADEAVQSFGSHAAQSLSTLARVGGHIPGTEWVSDKIGDILGLPKLATVPEKDAQGNPTGKMVPANPYGVVSDQMNTVASSDEQTTAGKVGAVGEGVAEFVLGEAALKGLTVGERLMEIAKTTKMLEKYPAMAKAAQQAMELKSLQVAGRIARTSALSAGQAGLHDQSMVQGAVSGALGGAVGEAAGAGATYLKTLTPEAKAAQAAADYTANAAKAQEALSAVSTRGAGQVENVALATAKNAGATTTEGVLKTPYNFNNAAFDIKASAKPVFEKLDEQSDGLFQTTQTRIDNARKIIRNGASTIQALADAQNELKAANDKMEDIFSTSDLGAKDLKTARGAWRKASTLEDLHDGLDKAYSVPSAALQSLPQDASITGLTPDQIRVQAALNPKKYSPQLNSVVRSIGRARLVDALGDEGVNQLYSVDRLFKQTLSNQKTEQTLLRVMTNAAAKAPKGSPLNTLGYELLTTGAGATLGAGYGAATAPQGERTAGALQGATIGGVIGGVAGVPVSIAHFLYTHPVIGIKLLSAVNRMAPPLSTATHVYSPETGTVEKAPQ